MGLNMIQFLSKLVGFLTTFVTFAFLIDFEKYSPTINTILIVAAILAVILLVIDAYQAFALRTRSFDRNTEKGKAKIANYLVKQLASSGSIAIFSKDLTWVKKNTESERLLIKKAQDGELTLFVEKELAITKILKLNGANVQLYGSQNKKGFSPKSRFTILDQRAGKTRVMVGIPSSDGKHLIKHYGNEDFEVVDLANDFVSLLKCVSKG